LKKQDVLPHLLNLIKPEVLLFPEVPLGDYKVIGLGKAAPAHVKALFEKTGEKKHLVITKESVPDLGLNCLYGGHPEYTEASFLNGEKLIEWIKEDQKDILFVLTGGASSVVEKLNEGIEKLEVLEQIKERLKTSTSIHDLNEYRKSISAIKGGGLKHLCKDRKIHTWIVKDVPGDDLTSVGSGPTLESGDQNFDVLSSFENLKSSIEKLEYQFIEALDCSLEEGLTQLLIPGRSISGGELTINVEGDGRGGRNTHFVLAAAYSIFEENRLKYSEAEMSKVFIASLASDGDDGNSNAAGGFLDYTSWKVAKSLGLDPLGFLNSSNSAAFLERIGCLYLTESTGTNVMDIRLIDLDQVK
jgi:glycerate 2-kinase